MFGGGVVGDRWSYIDLGDGSWATLSPDESENDTVDDPFLSNPDPYKTGMAALPKAKAAIVLLTGKLK